MTQNDEELKRAIIRLTEDDIRYHIMSLTDEQLEKLDAALAGYLRQKIEALRAENEKLREALGMARKRIEYLGIQCTNHKHYEANSKTYLPAIDQALKGGRGE